MGRLIVLHARATEGWVEGAYLRQKHTTTNSEEWFNKQILPNIPQNLVIILDNATYHNKQKDKPPTAASRKKEKKRLDSHTNEKEIKKTLLEKVCQHRPKPLY